VLIFVFKFIPLRTKEIRLPRHQKLFIFTLRVPTPIYLSDVRAQGGVQ
jgi:hypothetical protein